MLEWVIASTKPSKMRGNRWHQGNACRRSSQQVRYVVLQSVKEKLLSHAPEYKKQNKIITLPGTIINR